MTNTIRTEKTVREVGGEVFAELTRIPDEELGWQAKNKVIDILTGVLARYPLLEITNDRDLPVEMLEPLFKKESE